MKRDQLLFVDDIIESIGKIFRYTEGIKFEDFLNDHKTIDSVIRNLEVIGEAARNISEEIKIRYTDIPWVLLIHLRNKISHKYFGVDYKIIWETIKNDLPDLYTKINNLKSELEKQ